MLHALTCLLSGFVASKFNTLAVISKKYCRIMFQLSSCSLWCFPSHSIEQLPAYCILKTYKQTSQTFFLTQQHVKQFELTRQMNECIIYLINVWHIYYTYFLMLLGVALEICLPNTCHISAYFCWKIYLSYEEHMYITYWLSIYHCRFMQANSVQDLEYVAFQLLSINSILIVFYK